jgi:methyl-accepting chemotaxis protein
LLPELDLKVKAATTASADAAEHKGEVDGFVKTIKELYDSASTAEVLAIAETAEKQKEIAEQVMENAESVKTNSDELIKTITDAVKKAADMAKAADDARDTVENLHKDISPETPAEEILLLLD